MWFARQAIDKHDECLLVEGYTDVVSLHQAGVENVVASGGTSLTEDQLRLIRKYTNNLTIVYDGDAAGIKAALRGMDMALEEGLNVKLVLIPDKEDPDSYVNKVGANQFRDFVQANKKDVILFQLDVALREAGGEASRKAEVVNQIAETISRISKAEDFTRQQDYIRQASELLKIDEAGLTTLVNKFIRNRISLHEKKLPFEEAQQHAENAQKAEASNYDESTWELLFKDELQEKEIARVLLEHGESEWNENEKVSDHIFSEIIDDSLFENEEVRNLILNYKSTHTDGSRKNYFLYHADPKVSALAVSLLNFPYEESLRWKKEFSQATGYQDALFEQSYESFMQSIAPGNEDELMNYLKITEDKTHEEVDSAIAYLKLRKIKRLIHENQVDMEKSHDPAEMETLQKTHEHLKQMEMALTGKLGTVVYK